MVDIEIQKERYAIIFTYLNEEKEEKLDQVVQIIEFKKRKV